METVVTSRSLPWPVRVIATVVIAVLATAVLAGPAAAQEAPRVEDSAGAARLVELMNRDRAAVGIGPLTLRADVTAVALDWSHRMADVDALSHNDAYFTSATRQRLGAKALGENVAFNGSVEDAHDRLMASDGHRANILDPSFSVVGVAVVRTPDGLHWITEDFLQPSGSGTQAAPAAPAPAAPAPAAPAPAAPVPAAPAPAPAAPAPAPAPQVASVVVPAEVVAPPAPVVEADGPDPVPAQELVLLPAAGGSTPTSLDQELTASPLVPRSTAASQLPSADAAIRALALVVLAVVAVRLERHLTGPTRARLRVSRLRLVDLV